MSLFLVSLGPSCIGGGQKGQMPSLHQAPRLERAGARPNRGGWCHSCVPLELVTAHPEKKNLRVLGDGVLGGLQVLATALFFSPTTKTN